MSFKAGASRLALNKASSSRFSPVSLSRCGLVDAQSSCNLSTTSVKPQNAPSGSSPGSSAPELNSNQPPASSSKLLSGFAKLMGYNHNSATAIRSTNYYYDMIRDRHTKVEHKFWYEGMLVIFCATMALLFTKTAKRMNLTACSVLQNAVFLCPSRRGSTLRIFTFIF